jgi:hypothetical protein
MTDPKTKPIPDQTGGEEVVAEVAITDGDEQPVATDCPVGEPKGGPKVATKKKAATKKVAKKTPVKKKPAGKVRSLTGAAAKKASPDPERSAAAKKAAATRAEKKAGNPAEAKAVKARATRERRELPKVGTKLYARYKGKDYEAVIGQGDDGKAVAHAGKTYPTLSAAGKAVTGKPTCNGWVFWSTTKPGARKPRGKK